MQDHSHFVPDPIKHLSHLPSNWEILCS